MEFEGASTQRNARKNAHWTQGMTGFILKYLADAARNNLKGDRGFKSTVIHSACKELNKEFNLQYVDAHINNHIKSQKKNWRSIQSLKNMSGVHFDEATKTIVMGEEEARTLLEKNPSADKWINKPIMWYDEMELACGNDMANGNGSKTGRSSLGVPYDGLTSPVIENSQEGSPPDVVNLDDVGEEPRTPISNSTTSGSRKKKRAMDDLTSYVGDLVKAISKPKSYQVSPNMWEELKKLSDSYSKPQLQSALHHFLINETLGACFIAFDREERMQMIDQFLLLNGTGDSGSFPWG